MPTTENDRRNLQEPVLAQPSLPDHDRRNDPGMHSVVPHEIQEQQEQVKKDATQINPETPDVDNPPPPDQEFGQILASGHNANQGRIPEDPNNWNTSDPEKGYSEMDPENRGDSLPDYLERDRH